MDVRPAASGPVEPALPPLTGKTANGSAPQLSAAPKQAPLVTDTAVLEIISSANLTRLLAAALPELTPAIIERLDACLHAAARAATEGDVVRAHDQLAAAIALDPQRAESLPSDPRFEPVRTELDQLLARFTHTAKLEAETRLEQASQIIESPGPHKTLEWTADAAQLRSAAVRLLDANTYVNYLRSAHISQSIIDSANQFNPALNVFIPPAAEPEQAAFGLGVDKVNTPEPAPPGQEWSKFKSRLLIVWRRAPLGILLLGWLALGFGAFALSVLTGAPKSAFTLFYKIWTLGFLALVGLGFYASVRNIRFRP